ncbi:ring finger domain containing protein [Nitzschia inconspicua]|uniref:Ring finger domain containing protein n=1 Tax=Nitzschia inconspicua TaxID=303405 RepID=A0A9K3LLI7_9STRA|nr:ring finger domain containing protein [Nitzschia inconspicua]
MTKNGSFFVILSILFQSSMCFAYNIVDSAGMVTFFDLTNMGFLGPRTAYTRKAQIVYAHEDSNSLRLPPYHRLVVNLMLPPEEYPDLCSIPTQLLPNETDATENNSSESTTSNTTSSSGDSRLESLLEDVTLPIGFEFSPVAFLVPLQRNRVDSNSTDTGDCDVLTKIKVALQYQQHVFRDQQLWSVIFYSTHSDDYLGADEQDNLVYSMGIPDDVNSTDIPGLDSLVLASISHTTAIDIKEEMQRSVDVQYSKQMQESLMVDQGGYFAPYFFLNPGNLDWRYPVSLERGANIPFPGRDGQMNEESGGSYWGNYSFVWFRFVLFAIILCFPFIRCARMWWAAGGRIRFTRNERGWITGLTYQPPATNWLNITNGSNLANGTSTPSRRHKMTKEQVLALPEIKYEGWPENSENVDRHENGDVVENNLEQEGAGRNVANIESTSHSIQLQDATSSELVGEEATTSQTVDSLGATQGDDGNLVCSAVEKEARFTTTLSTMCSICIDDFEHGEMVRLLPRCGHAFHTECILPWLTERQNYCPFCKTKVQGAKEGDRGEENEEGAADENNPTQEDVRHETDVESQQPESESRNGR